jgi:hypothetical protein
MVVGGVGVASGSEPPKAHHVLGTDLYLNPSAYIYIYIYI